MARRGGETLLWIVGMAILLSPSAAPPAPAPDLPPPAPAIVPRTATLPVNVVRQAEVPAGPRVKEAVAYTWLLVDTFLGDLAGVTPVVDGVPTNPGVALALAAESAAWTVSVDVSVQEDVLTVVLEACDPAGVCVTHEGVGSRVVPNDLVGDLVARVGAQMGRQPPFDPAVWRATITRDEYAVLMAGRAAAVLYGLSPPVEPELSGDNKRDPIARAAFIDGRLLGVWSVTARTTTDPQLAIMAWKLASDGFPQSPALKAGHAAALEARGLTEPAAGAWRAVGALAPSDLRFVVPRARSALAVGNVAEAEQVLTLVPPGFERHPLLAMMRVEVATARDKLTDELLAAWQDADPANPEPPRRRLWRAIAAGELEVALGHVPALAERGAGEEAGRLDVALSTHLGRWAQGAAAAERLGESDVGRRLKARGATDAAARVASLTGAQDPVTRLALGRALLAAGQAKEAREVADALVKADAWWPEALALQSDALAALGLAQQAGDARARLVRVDPLYPGDAVAAAGATP